MIQKLQSGNYELIETVAQTKILILDKVQTFAWVNAHEIGEILVTSHKPHKIDYTIAKGSYYLYDVRDEKDYTDLLHIELYVGENTWQGYLLPTGLPTETKKRNRIIPTKEVITKEST